MAIGSTTLVVFTAAAIVVLMGARLFVAMVLPDTHPLNRWMDGGSGGGDGQESWLSLVFGDDGDGGCGGDGGGD